MLAVCVSDLNDGGGGDRGGSYAFVLNWMSLRNLFLLTPGKDQFGWTCQWKQNGEQKSLELLSRKVQK